MKLATTKLFRIDPTPDNDVTHAGLGPDVWNWLTRYGITFKATKKIALTEDELTDDDHKREAKKARREVEKARIPSPACSETDKTPLIEILAQGFYGFVLLATDENGADCALKICLKKKRSDADIQAEFAKESITKQLPEHPNILQVVRGEILTDVFILQMPYIPATLRSILRNKTQQLTLELAVLLKRGINNAFKHCHQQKPGLLHNDPLPSKHISGKQRLGK